MRFTPVRSADLTQLLRELRRRLGYGAVRRDGSGVAVAAREVTWLLDDGVAERLGVQLDASARRALEVRRRASSVHDRYLAYVRHLRDGGYR